MKKSNHHKISKGIIVLVFRIFEMCRALQTLRLQKYY
jgi:hypothetical protein